VGRAGQLPFSEIISDWTRLLSQEVNVDPRRFAIEVVQPNLDDFKAEPGSMRHAYNAVNWVDSLAAHVYSWAKGNLPACVARWTDDTAFRAELARRNRDF
jgi:hypothetical protein